MATPRRIYAIYTLLADQAAAIQAQQEAAGEQVSGTVKLLLSGNRGRLLSRWGEEMAELCGVLDGTHDDSFLLESTQCFYWGSLFAVTGGVSFDQLGLVDLMATAASQPQLATTGEVMVQVKRLVALGPDEAKPVKCFLLWAACDAMYRRQTAPDKQWALEQIMEADLQDMKTRSYLQQLIAATDDL